MLATLAVLLLVQETPAESPELQPVEKRIVVTATRHESDLLDVPSSVTILDAEEIRRSNARTLVDVLHGRPGIHVTKLSSTPQDAAVDVRGFNNGGGNGSRTLVLVDGRKVNTPDGSTVDWAAIPLENVERIEVVRGPAAALYGDGAVGAVVNVITRKAGPAPRRHLSAEAGSYATDRETASYSFRSEPAGVSLFAARGSSEGFRDNSGWRGIDASGLVDLAFGPGTAWLKFALHEDTRERPGSLSKSDIELLGRDGTKTEGDETDVRTASADIGADWDVLEGTLSPLLTWTDGSTANVLTFGGTTYTFDIGSASGGAGLKFVRAAGPVTLLFGVEAALESASSESASPGFFAGSDYDRRLLGAYARMEARAAAPLLLSG